MRVSSEGGSRRSRYRAHPARRPARWPARRLLGSHDGRDGSVPRLADAGKRQGELAHHVQGGVLFGRHLTELGQRDAVHLAQRGKITRGTFLDGDDHTPGAFREQPYERISAFWQFDAGTHSVPQRRLHDSQRQPAVGKIMSAGKHATTTRPDQHLSQRLLVSKINGEPATTEMIMNNLCPSRAGELITSPAEQVDRLSRHLEPTRGPSGDIVYQAEYTNHRRRQDWRIACLVIEADVAAGHRSAQFAAAVHEPAYRLAELPHDRRIFWGSEVETVGDRQRHRTGGRDIAVRLRQG